MRSDGDTSGGVTFGVPAPCPAPSQKLAGKEAGFLVLILLAGAALRFYRLETPSMWWDEVLTALMARFSPDYIVAWCSSLEVHPPFFYFLVKGAMLGGQSDFALRWPLALCGLAHIVLCFHLCRRYYDVWTGLFFALLLAVCPLHILLSRQVRPYPILFGAAAASILLFRAWLSGRSHKTLFGLAACNALVAAMHFEGVMLVGVEFFMAGACALYYGKKAWTRLTAFCAANLLALAPTLYFFWLTAIHRTDMIHSGGALHVAGRLLVGLHSLFWAFLGDPPLDHVAENLSAPPAATSVVVFGLALVGSVPLWRRDRILTILLWLMALMPAAALVLGGENFMRTRHLMVIFLPLMLFAGAALARATSRPGPRLALLAGLTVALTAVNFATKEQALYKTNSYTGQIDNFREEARALVSSRSMEAYLFTSANQANAMGWYLDLWAQKGPLRHFALSPDQTEATFNFLVNHKLDELTPAESRLLGELGHPHDILMLYDTPMLRWAWPRQPVHRAASLPASWRFSPDPRDLYVSSHSLRDLTLHWEKGVDKIVAMANNSPGEVWYAFANESGRTGRARVDLAYANQGEGNRLELLAAEDAARPEVLLASSGVDLRQETTHFLPLNKGATLRVGCRLTTDVITPEYPGSNLLSNSIQGLTVAFSPSGSDSVLRAVGFEGLGPVETAEGFAFRWAEGPKTTMVFTCAHEGSVTLRMRYQPCFPGQNVEVSLNGVRVERLENIPVLPRLVSWLDLDLTLPVVRGENRLVLRMAKWSHQDPKDRTLTFAPDDPRKLALLVGGLSLDGEDFMQKIGR